MILATTPAFEPLPGHPDAARPSTATSTTAAGVDPRVPRRARAARCAQRHLARARRGSRSSRRTPTRSTDLMRFLFGNAALHFQVANPLITQRCAVVAQGGYGRGRAEPVLRHRPARPLSVEGDAVRRDDRRRDPLSALGRRARRSATRCGTSRECARWAARDLKAKTAILDARYLCGDESVFAEFDARDARARLVGEPGRLREGEARRERRAPRAGRRHASTSCSRS